MTKVIDAFLNFANAPKSDKGEMMQALSETFVLHIANFWQRLRKGIWPDDWLQNTAVADVQKWHK